MKTRLLLAVMVLTALIFVPDGAARAHSGIMVDGAYGEGEWLAGFGSNGCPAFPGNNSGGFFSDTNGCTGPMGTEWIWKDAENDNRTDNGDEQDLNTFRLAGSSTALYGLAEFYPGDGSFDCNRVIVMIAVDTDSGAGGNVQLPAYSSDTDTNVDFGSGDGWERVIELSTARRGVWDASYNWSGTGVDATCSTANRLFEFSVDWSALGVTLPVASYRFMAAVFGRYDGDTGGGVQEVYGPNLVDVISDLGTWGEIQDNDPDTCPTEVQSGDDCADDYQFSMGFSPTAVELINLNASVRPSPGPAIALAGVALLGLGLIAWRKSRRGW